MRPVTWTVSWSWKASVAELRDGNRAIHARAAARMPASDSRARHLGQLRGREREPEFLHTKTLMCRDSGADGADESTARASRDI